MEHQEGPLRLLIDTILSRISHTILFRQSFRFQNHDWSFDSGLLYTGPTDPSYTHFTFKSQDSTQCTPRTLRFFFRSSFMTPVSSLNRATPAGRLPIPSISYVCDNLVLQARAWPHLLLHCGSPPSPRWRLKSSKLFHICLLESFDSALHCCHPLFSPFHLLPIVCHSNPHFVSSSRSSLSLILWSLVPLVRPGFSSLHLSYRAVVPVTLVHVLVEHGRKMLGKSSF